MFTCNFRMLSSHFWTWTTKIQTVIFYNTITSLGCANVIFNSHQFIHEKIPWQQQHPVFVFNFMQQKVLNGQIFLLPQSSPSPAQHMQLDDSSTATTGHRVFRIPRRTLSTLLDFQEIVFGWRCKLEFLQFSDVQEFLNLGCRSNALQLEFPASKN